MQTHRGKHNLHLLQIPRGTSEGFGWGRQVRSNETSISLQSRLCSSTHSSAVAKTPGFGLEPADLGYSAASSLGCSTHTEMHMHHDSTHVHMSTSPQVRKVPEPHQGPKLASQEQTKHKQALSRGTPLRNSGCCPCQYAMTYQH